MGIDWDEPPIVTPPNTFTVEGPNRHPILYKPDGTPLVKRPVGFDTESVLRDKRHRII
jgi:hypothetical protein